MYFCIYIHSMKVLETSYDDINALPALAERILALAAGRKVFAFYAPMGAGKTTLIKELCRLLGTTDNLSSPTYSIVNEYEIKGKAEKIYHIDLYRLQDMTEALAVGIDDCMDGTHYCFIEWPDVITPLLPVQALKINIDVDGNTRNMAIFMD
jgi:tRNA threonylcarbamoyladenosine biosynthesis protein TsaE